MVLKHSFYMGIRGELQAILTAAWVAVSSVRLKGVTRAGVKSAADFQLHIPVAKKVTAAVFEMCGKQP